ncbi:MAG: hypothetical protein R3C19_23545 [Planctomycetaceae bacterium]
MSISVESVASLTPHVDVVILTRPGEAVPASVQRAVCNQTAVRLTVHLVQGHRLPSDSNRCETIARARQFGSRCGGSPWLMFVDDDVLLHPDCVRQLLDGLRSRPTFAALAADYGNQRSDHGPSLHVTMGATLFRREAFRYFHFRWDNQRCECRCCSEDLRGQGLLIDYLPTAFARHLTDDERDGQLLEYSTPVARPTPESSSHAQVLAAINRRHFDRFRGPFLRTLRGCGNLEQVTVAGYGLYSSEVRRLEMLPGVRVVNHTPNGVLPPIRRLRDFQPIVAALPPDTPVAYWDAGDVVFQSSLQPLWEIVRQTPNRLLAVREPKGFPANSAVAAWTLSIDHPVARRNAFELLASHPFLNSGFAAGTARTMLAYFRTADRLRHSEHLAGTSDWGDQSALNLYCHSNPGAWREISESWNYCIHDRLPGEVFVAASGRLTSRRGTPIRVAHGNARSLRKLWLPRYSDSALCPSGRDPSNPACGNMWDQGPFAECQQTDCETSC